MPLSIGERIKTLRNERGMTLADFGKRVSLSTSYLSQIERDKTTPSFSTLLEIAKALNVGPRYFFEDEAEVAYVLRAGNGQDHQPADTQASPLRLTPGGEGNKLEIFRIQLEPHTALEQFDPFSGEVLGFVLSGQTTVKLGEEEYILAAGDSIHYSASRAYDWINTGDEQCVVILGRVASRIERLP
ncbi:MAG TPA: XRE family transcriptional regulator [Anaerolineales bacterium]